MWQLECPFVTSAQRPTATLSEEAADWADDMIDDRPVALLFPFAAYVPRTWPLHKWIRLAHALQGKGFKVIALHSHVEGLEQFPFYAYGFSLMHVMALMRAADVVIANDSGPAHLAGTLGTKTIAICGPTDPHTVFSYCPDIFPIATTAELIGCTGCHFKASLGFTSACDVGCDSLANLGHMLVLKR